MPRLFSAIVPAEPVLADLVARLAAADVPNTGATAGPDGDGRDGGGLRWIPAERWHITLGFFGDDDDPVRRATWLRRRLAGRGAPTLRLAGGGTFSGVFWAGVQPADEPDRVALARLAQAAGAGRRGYHPHLTLARWRGGRPEWPTVLDGYTGPWFTPGEVSLVRSEFGASGPAYHTIERFPLAGV